MVHIQLCSLVCACLLFNYEQMQLLELTRAAELHYSGEKETKQWHSPKFEVFILCEICSFTMYYNVILMHLLARQCFM